jgi:hypothetical protein
MNVAPSRRCCAPDPDTPRGGRQISRSTGRGRSNISAITTSARSRWVAVVIPPVEAMALIATEDDQATQDEGAPANLRAQA